MGKSCRVHPISSALLALGTLSLTLAACGSGVPSPDSASQVLRSSIDKGSDTRLRLISFQKTDGRAMDISGLKVYELMFTADAEFVSNATFIIDSPLMSQASKITTAPLCQHE